MRADTADALARLGSCGAEAELIALAKDCMAAEPQDRPRDAGVVAGRITAYLAGVQARVQAAERERAVAVARAIEERRRRKLQLGLAASVLALTTLGGLSTMYFLEQRASQSAATDRIVGQAVTLRDQALAHPDDLSRWQVALAALEQAEAGGNASARDRLLALRSQIQGGLDAAERDRTLMDDLADIRSAETDDSDGSSTDAAYAAAFREAKIDVASLPPEEAGAKIRSRSPSVTIALAAAIDDWAAICRGRKEDGPAAARLSEASRAADPDLWRNQLRKALEQSDKAVRLTELQALARTAKFDELGAISLHLLGSALNETGDSTLAESVLRRAQNSHPDDVWVNYALAEVLKKLSRRDEAIRFYSVAQAIRPDTAHSLAHALDERGDLDEAVAVFRNLKRLRPRHAGHLACLGRALNEKGLSREADEMLEAAAAVEREAIRLNPTDAFAHFNLGKTLSSQAKSDAAIAEFQTAIRLQPDLVIAHTSLGIQWRRQGNLDLAIAEYRTVTRLNPDRADAHNNLGVALMYQGKLDEAIDELRSAIQLRPDYAVAFCNLGNTLRLKGNLDEAATELRTAIRLKPEYAEALCNLGLVLQKQGHDSGALEMLRKGHKLGARRPDWRYPSAQWVADAERTLSMAKRLPAMLRGEDQPKDNAERLAFAQIAYDRKHFTAARRLWALALESDPKLGDDRQNWHRYNAACSAALAVAGQGKDAPPADDAAKATLRRQALDWLQAELAAWTKHLDSGPPQERPEISKTLDHWKQDTDLVSVRDAEPLAKLPDEERKAWQQLWADVDSLLTRAGSQP